MKKKYLKYLGLVSILGAFLIFDLAYAEDILNKTKEESSREPLYRDSLSHHRTSDVAYGGFAVMFTKS